MKKSLLFATLLMTSGAEGFAADTVELNGITSLFGENMAFLLLHQPVPAAPVSFYLFEGQSQHGIKLLAVDVANRRVQIERDGQTQFMRLSSAPDLAPPHAPAMVPGRPGGIRRITPGQQAQLDQFLNTDADVQNLISGKPIFTGAYVGAPPPATSVSGNTPGGSSSGGAATGPDASGSSGNSASSPASSTATGGSAATGPAATPADSASSSATDYTSQYWYVTSRNIELNRLNTASQVMSGEMGALPLTPLTPANTPPVLIGSDTFFASHIPGFPYGGSVAGSADQDQ